MPDSDERVLFKTRRQRLYEGFLVPAIALPIGPLLRAAMGDSYSFFLGLLAMMATALLFNWGSYRLAPRFGGEWVTPSERLRRYAAETIATPRWLATISTAAMIAGILFAIFLIADPIAEWRDTAGIGAVVSMIAAISVFSVFQLLRGQTELRDAAIMDVAAPSGYLRQVLSRVLPRLYATYFLATIIAVAVTLQVAPAQRWSIFTPAAIIIATVLRLLSPGRLLPKRLYAFTPTLRDRMIMALACGGIPLAILMSGLPILQWWSRPALAAAVIVCMVIVFGIGSLAIGAAVHGLTRLAERRGQVR